MARFNYQKTGYIGVEKIGPKDYRASFKNNRQRVIVGYFTDSEAAARARDLAVIAKYGIESVRELNFPLEAPVQPIAEPAEQPRNMFSLSATLSTWPDLKDAYVPATEEDGQLSFENIPNYAVAVWNVANGAVSSAMVTA